MTFFNCAEGKWEKAGTGEKRTWRISRCKFFFAAIIAIAYIWIISLNLQLDWPGRRGRIFRWSNWKQKSYCSLLSQRVYTLQVGWSMMIFTRESYEAGNLLYVLIINFAMFNFFRIIDKHLKILAPKYFDTKFIRVDVEVRIIVAQFYIVVINFQNLHDVTRYGKLLSLGINERHGNLHW